MSIGRRQLPESRVSHATAALALIGFALFALFHALQGL
jgi:hypothetical protein